MNKTAKTVIGIIIVIILVWIVFFYYQKPVNNETIKIGALLTLSGDAAAWGENAQNGVDLAVDEFRQDNPDKQIEILYEDTGGETKKAVSSYQKLVNIDKVDAIIGPVLQTEVAAISPLVDKDGVPIITPSYAPISNRSNPRNPLMIWMNPTIEAEQMADYVYEQGIRKIGILGTLDSWENEVSDAFASKFTSLGGEILDKEIVQPDTGDVKLSVSKILDKNPEAIFLGTYYQFVQAIRPVKELGFNGKLYSIEVDSYLASETKQFSNGLQFISPESYAEDFITKFEEIYDKKPGIPAGQAYDATKILLSFLEKSLDKLDVLKAMENFERYEGASGEIVLTADHKTLLPTAIFELQDGEAIKIK